MSESRYKIEYIKKEPAVEKNFRFFGAFGYLWLALLASVLLYGIVFKHIPTSQVISYFQNIKTEVIDTEISSLIKVSNSDITTLPEQPKAVETTEEITGNNVITQEPKDTQKLVSEIINDDQLPEDVVFESEPVEPVSNQTQQEETETIVKEINKDKKFQETKVKTAVASISEKTIENATNAIEKEIQKADAATQEIPEKLASKAEEKKSVEQNPVENNQQNEAIIKTTAIEKPQEAQVETANTSKAEPATEKSKPLEESKEATIEIKSTPAITLSKLITDAIANPAKNDLAYIKAVKKYELNKVADENYLKANKAKENITNDSTQKDDEKATKEKVSEVDAIIAAMNADKEAKNKPPLSYQEKLQSEINQLLNR